MLDTRQQGKEHEDSLQNYFPIHWGTFTGQMDKEAEPSSFTDCI